jgi:hypothetical protein
LFLGQEMRERTRPVGRRAMVSAKTRPHDTPNTTQTGPPWAQPSPPVPLATVQFGVTITQDSPPGEPPQKSVSHHSAFDRLVGDVAVATSRLNSRRSSRNQEPRFRSTAMSNRLLATVALVLAATASPQLRDPAVGAGRCRSRGRTARFSSRRPASRGPGTSADRTHHLRHHGAGDLVARVGGSSRPTPAPRPWRRRRKPDAPMPRCLAASSL